MTDEGKVLATARTEFSVCAGMKVTIEISSVDLAVTSDYFESFLDIAAQQVSKELHGLALWCAVNSVNPEHEGLVDSVVTRNHELRFLHMVFKATAKVEFGKVVVPLSSMDVVIYRWLQAIVDEASSTVLERSLGVPVTAGAITASTRPVA